MSERKQSTGYQRQKLTDAMVRKAPAKEKDHEEKMRREAKSTNILSISLLNFAAYATIKDRLKGCVVALNRGDIRINPFFSMNVVPGYFKT